VSGFHSLAPNPVRWRQDFAQAFRISLAGVRKSFAGVRISFLNIEEKRKIAF